MDYIRFDLASKKAAADGTDFADFWFF